MEEGFDKRIIVAIVLSLVVLIVYNLIFPPPPPPQTREERIPAVSGLKKDSVVPRSNKAVEREVAPHRREQLPFKEETIIVETPLYRALLSTSGGTIKEWKLKSYSDENGNEIVLMRPEARVPALNIGVDNSNLTGKLGFSLPEGQKNITIKGATETASLTFLYSDANITIKRTYNFYGDGYRIDLIDEVEGPSSYWLTLGSNFGISGSSDNGYRGHSGPVVLKDADRIELNPKKISEPKIYGDNLRWIAQEDKYFFASIVPFTAINQARIWRDNSGEIITALQLPSGKNRLLIYSGPKEHDRLKKLGVGLEHIIDFGFFSILARPLFWILKLFYRFIGNYGWAIVLLTIIVRIPFIPLINKGQKSMKKLQSLQPKMNEIRQKYKKDPQRMQKEMMELYKKYKVNPMSGCLPMLIQIPVFFALYKVLLVAIELRNAPFIFWIKDLSAKDPYYVLPIVMGLTMFIQQKMTPTPMESQQQKIMQFLPLIFTFMFLNFSSGLVLYWLVSNILSIVQQFYNNRKLATAGSGS